MWARHRSPPVVISAVPASASTARASLSGPEPAQCIRTLGLRCRAPRGTSESRRERASAAEWGRCAVRVTVEWRSLLASGGRWRGQREWTLTGCELSRHPEHRARAGGSSRGGLVARARAAATDDSGRASSQAMASLPPRNPHVCLCSESLLGGSLGKARPCQYLHIGRADFLRAAPKSIPSGWAREDTRYHTR